MTACPSLESLADALRQHHNEICLVHDTDIVRFVGVGADDHDLYYIVQNRSQRRRRDAETNIVWASAVGHIQPLKAAMPESAYARMESVFTLNGCPPTDSFAVENQGIWDREASSLDRHISRCGRIAITFDREQPRDRFALWRCYPDTPDRGDAFILNGEIANLEAIAKRMIDEMIEWAELREAD